MLTYRLDHLPLTAPISYLTICAHTSSGSGRLLYQTCSQLALTPRNMKTAAREFCKLAPLRFTAGLGSEAYSDHVHYVDPVRQLWAAFIAGYASAIAVS